MTNNHCYKYTQSLKEENIRVIPNPLQLQSSFNNPNCEKVVGLERGPLSLVSTTEELLDRKVAAPV
jgi:hypothetical protein